MRIAGGYNTLAFTAKTFLADKRDGAGNNTTPVIFAYSNPADEAEDGIGAAIQFGVKADDDNVYFGEIQYVLDDVSVATLQSSWRFYGLSGGAYREQFRIEYFDSVIPVTRLYADFLGLFDANNGGTSLAFHKRTAQFVSSGEAMHIWCQDSSDNEATLAFFTEQSVEAIGGTVPTHKLKIRHKGTEYYLLLATA